MEQEESLSERIVGKAKKKTTPASKLELIGKQASELEKLRRECADWKKEYEQLEEKWRQHGLHIEFLEGELELQWARRAIAVLALIRTMTRSIEQKVGGVTEIRKEIDTVLQGVPYTMRLREGE